MSDRAGRAPVVVIGIGAELRGDDGVGPAAVAAFVARRPPAGTADVVLLDGEPAGLLEAWRDRRLAVVVDAVRAGLVPGSILEVDGAAATPGPPGRGTSSHGGGLAEAVALGAVLDRLPERLVILGVEPADLEPGAGLSPAVAAALPELVGRVASAVGSLGGVETEDCADEAVRPC